MGTDASPTQEFFDSLGARANDPHLAKLEGTLRFDLEHDGRVERWHVTLHKGEVTVSHKNAKADGVIYADRALFDRIVSGQENAMAALLRCALIPEGDPALLLKFQRAFASPAQAPETPTAGYSRRLR